MVSKWRGGLKPGGLLSRRSTLTDFNKAVRIDLFERLTPEQRSEGGEGRDIHEDV